MTLPVLSVPRFKTLLPLSNKEIEYRPFLVKEEKLLILANESNNVSDVTDAIENIVKNCTDGAVDAQNNSMFDVQHMFLQIRGKSIGESLEFYFICKKDECNNKKSMEINVSDFKLTSTPEHTDMIDLGNGCNLKMRYPTFKDFSLLYEDDKDDNVYDVVASCIEQIITQEEVIVNKRDNIKEYREFVDNLTPDQFSKIEKFFETMPILKFETTYTCEACGTVNDITIDGIRNFFG